MHLNEDGNLIISGIATTNRVDAEGDSVTLSPNGFNTMYKQYIKDGGKILAEHGRTREYNHKVVGRCISLIYPDDYSIDTPTIQPLEVKIIVEIFDPKAIQDLLDGKFKGFSIKCEAQSFYKSGSYYVITSGIMHEISICQFPVNRDCELHIVTDESIMEQFGFKKGDSVQALGKQGVITNIYTKAEQPYYEIQYPQFTKSMIIPQTMLEKTNQVQKIKITFSKGGVGSKIVTKAGKKGRSGRKKRGGVKRYDPAKFSVASRAQQNSYVSAQRSQSGDRYKDIGRVRTGGIWDMMKAYTCTISNQKDTSFLF